MLHGCTGQSARLLRGTSDANVARDAPLALLTPAGNSAEHCRGLLGKQHPARGPRLSSWLYLLLYRVLQLLVATSACDHIVLHLFGLRWGVLLLWTEGCGCCRVCMCLHHVVIASKFRARVVRRSPELYGVSLLIIIHHKCHQPRISRAQCEIPQSGAVDENVYVETKSLRFRWQTELPHLGAPSQKAHTECTCHKQDEFAIAQHGCAFLHGCTGHSAGFKLLRIWATPAFSVTSDPDRSRRPRLPAG